MGPAAFGHGTVMAGKLSAYRSMRDFNRTPEPSGDDGTAGDARRFVVQRHRARRLHYDLRLEVGAGRVRSGIMRCRR